MFYDRDFVQDDGLTAGRTNRTKGKVYDKTLYSNYQLVITPPGTQVLFVCPSPCNLSQSSSIVLNRPQSDEYSDYVKQDYRTRFVKTPQQPTTLKHDEPQTDI